MTNKRFMKIPVGEILVSTPELEEGGYQRKLKRHHIRKNFKAYSPEDAKEIRVSCRLDGPNAGSYFVYDGQHRVASALRDEGPEYPIDSIVEDLTLKEEALRFRDQQKGTARVAPGEMFYAGLMGGHPDDLDMEAIATEIGWRIARSATGSQGDLLGNVGLLRTIYHDRGRDNFWNTLYIAAEANGPAVLNRGHGRLLDGISYLLWKFPKARVERVIEVLQWPELPPTDLLKIEKNWFGNGGDRGRGMAMVLYRAYNHKIPTKTKRLHDEEFHSSVMTKKGWVK